MSGYKRARRSVLVAAAARQRVLPVEQRVKIQGAADEVVRSLKSLEAELKAGQADEYTIKDLRRLLTSVRRIKAQYQLKKDK